MEIDRSGLQVLGRTDCLELLGTTHLGRVGVSWRALPMILPVHFTMDADRIIVATWDGSILSKTTRGTVVAFEAEGPNGCAEPVWSVLVNGIADHCAMHHPGVPSPRWAVVEPCRLVSITVDHVTSRREAPPDGTFGSGRATTFAR